MAFPARPAREWPDTGEPRPAVAASDGGPGGRAAPVDNAVIGTVIFIAAETMLFAGLVSALLILRAGAEGWPPPGQPRLPVAVTGLNTAVLLLSALAVRRAAVAARRRTRGGVARWLGVTATLGATFLAIQGTEWIRLLHHGLTARTSVYGGTFYTVIGCHGLHVLGAVGALLVVLARVTQDRRPEGLRGALAACQLYWLFVVGVWPVLYVLVYLV
jgi:cytochrome c oxidase subunit 3